MPNVLVLDGVIERASIATLCDRARRLFERAGKGPLICDVADLESPDAVAIEALARLRLMARRLRRRIEVRGACGELRRLLTLAGLRHVIDSPRRQASSRSGNPKSGKRCAVSRKKQMPVMRSPETSITCNAHGS